MEPAARPHGRLGERHRAGRDRTEPGAEPSGCRSATPSARNRARSSPAGDEPSVDAEHGLRSPDHKIGDRFRSIEPFGPWRALTLSRDRTRQRATLAPTLGIETWPALNPSTDSDAELIRAVANGDRAAFERLFRLYHPRIYKFSIRMLQDHSMAEEVVNDSLYAVWTGASGFRGQSAASSWILGIAYRRSLKSYNRNARHVESREPAYEIETVAEPSPNLDPETYTSNALAVDRMQKALSTLSRDHRAVMELIGLGYSVGEIADIVECPENTVKTRTFHARRHLRAALQGNES